MQRFWGPLFHELKEEFEDTKGVIRNRKSKRTKNIMINEKGKRTSNDLQNITQKTKDQTTRTLPKTGDVLGYSGRVSSSWSTCGNRRVYKPGDKSWIRKGTDISSKIVRGHCSKPGVNEALPFSGLMLIVFNDSAIYVFSNRNNNQID